MTPRPDVSEERRSQILDAAMMVFARHGLNKARMDDIVAESGLSKGTLYWYFKSKDDIIVAILTNLFESEFANLRDLQTADVSPTELLLELSKLVANDIQRISVLQPITYEFYALAFRQKTVRDTLKNYFHSYLEILTPIIQEGIDQGEFHRVDPQEAVIAAAAIIEGTILLWVYDPETIDLEKHINTSMQLFLKGLQV